MATHPVEPDEPDGAERDAGVPNPTRLPVEPEFGPMEPPAEPEDPAGQPPA